MKSNNDGPSNSRLKLYESHSFEVLHNHRVDVNSLGEAVEVDFSATDSDMLVPVAILKAYEAGRREGIAALQAELRSIMGIQEPNT